MKTAPQLIARSTSGPSWTSRPKSPEPAASEVAPGLRQRALDEHPREDARQQKEVDAALDPQRLDLARVAGKVFRRLPAPGERVPQEEQAQHDPIGEQPLGPQAERPEEG